jgi:hypothetical protein
MVFGYGTSSTVVIQFALVLWSNKHEPAGVTATVKEIRFLVHAVDGEEGGAGEEEYSGPLILMVRCLF